MPTRCSLSVALAAASLIAVMRAVGAEDPGDRAQSDALRLPTPDELVYLVIAWDTGLAAVCERISPDAYEQWLFNPRGQQVAFTRSRCYMGVAENTHDASLCDRVVSISIALHDGSHYSAETCAVTAAGDPQTNQRFPPHADLQRVLAQYGYGLDELLGRCRAYFEERAAWLRSGAGETTRARLVAVPPERPVDGVEQPARSHPRHDRLRLDEFLFGPHQVPEYDRPYRMCARFFDTELRAEPFDLRFAAKDRAAVEEAYDGHIYEIYRALARTPEFRRRIVALEPH